MKGRTRQCTETAWNREEVAWGVVGRVMQSLLEPAGQLNGNTVCSLQDTVFYQLMPFSIPSLCEWLYTATSPSGRESITLAHSLPTFAAPSCSYGMWSPARQYNCNQHPLAVQQQVPYTALSIVLEGSTNLAQEFASCPFGQQPRFVAWLKYS